MPKLTVLTMLVTLSCIAPASWSLADQNVVVILDDSGSMDERMNTSSGRVLRIDAAKKALVQVLTTLPPETNVGVLALNTQVKGSNWVIPLGKADPSKWASIQSIRADGGTPLGEFLKRGVDALLESRSKQVYGTYRLLIVTDGEANDPELVDGYLPDIMTRGLTVDVIGVDMQSDHSLATRVHNYRRADDESALTQAISEVFAETSADDPQAEEDFALFEGLPDEFASQALQALAKRSDAPIELQDSDQDQATVSANGSGSIRSSTGASLAFVSLVCCFGVFASVAMLVVVLAKSSKRRR